MLLLAQQGCNKHTTNTRSRDGYVFIYWNMVLVLVLWRDSLAFKFDPSMLLSPQFLLLDVAMRAVLVK